MIFTVDQFRAFSAGAVSVFKDEKGVHFDRFTERQHCAWKVDRPESDAYEDSFTTTGCCLDFHTDSTALRLKVASGNKFEVLVDGLQRCLHTGTPKEALCLDLGPGEKRVTVVLPSHSVGVIDALQLDHGCRVWPHAYSRRILFLGDSITQGWDARWDSLSYAYQVGRFFDAKVLNYAIGGTCFVPDTLEDVGFDPDWIIVSYGTNDFTRFSSPQELQARCSAYLDRLSALFPQAKVFCVTPIWRPDGEMQRPTGKLSQVRAYITSAALARGFSPVDGLSLVPALPEFFADGYLHPNDLGFGMYAMNLVRRIQETLG